ncbi:hypothetical protein ACQZV8_15835 [Magnetococcales bacterium HHB-1]
MSKRLAFFAGLSVLFINGCQPLDCPTCIIPSPSMPTLSTASAKEVSLSQTARPAAESVLEQEKQTFDRIWNRALPKLEDAGEVRDKMDKAPDSTFFGDDKKSLRKDLDAILDDLGGLLTDRKLSDYQKKLAEIKAAIKEERHNIARYKEQRLGAPVKHIWKTTKTKYDNKIKASQENIKSYKNDIQLITQQFITHLNKFGVNLTPDRAEVLLTRVDADDIVGMTLIFDSVKAISKRLMELTKESGEELSIAKRYYSMHVTLLELMIHIQERYRLQVDQKYLPRLRDVMKEARQVQSDARRELARETSRQRRSIYQNNIQAHQLTIKTATLYEKALNKQKEKVLQAQARIQRDLSAASNTLKTVMISAELLQILKNSQQSFQALMNMQVPELVPFQNLEMKKKFEDLSAKLASGE